MKLKNHVLISDPGSSRIIRVFSVVAITLAASVALAYTINTKRALEWQVDNLYFQAPEPRTVEAQQQHHFLQACAASEIPEKKCRFLLPFRK